MLEIMLGLSVGIILLLLIGIRNLLKQNEELEDDLVKYITDMRILSEQTLESMKQIDTRGAFESDDEVGAIFKDLKNAVEHLNQRVSEYNVRAQGKEN